GWPWGVLEITAVCNGFQEMLISSEVKKAAGSPASVEAGGWILRGMQQEEGTHHGQRMAPGLETKHQQQQGLLHIELEMKCWLVVSSVVVALPSGLRCITWLPCVLGLRCAIGLASAFWKVFPERCLGRSGGGSSQDRPLSFLAEVLPRSALCSFWATVVLPLWFVVCRLIGLRSGDVLLRRLLALLVECVLDCASACALEAFRVVVLVLASLSVTIEVVLLALVRQGVGLRSPCGRVSALCFGVLLRADVVVVLLKLSTFRVLLLWVSGGESPSVGPVSSRAIGAVVCAAP
ncbi:hypothetical protein Taro_046257, partial [Colocasia esculenta]|nr:hypothetical protein [Colocasia esculenta]